MNGAIYSKRQCSLLRYVHISPGSINDWKRIAYYHYRQHRPGLVDKIFVMQLADRPDHQAWKMLGRRSDELIGVIVYGMPMANVALRNVATAGRYTGWTDRAAGLRLLNQEIRCIKRVVIRPECRGMGLGRQLVAQTLPLAGTVLVEALAVMGRVNPFFEHAGMNRYEGPPSPACQRLLEAFACFDITPDSIANPRTLVNTLTALPAETRNWLILEMCSFSKSYLSQHQLPTNGRLPALASIVSTRLLCRPVYFLWKRPEHPLTTSKDNSHEY